MSVLQSKRRAIINEPHKESKSGSVCVVDNAEYAPMNVVANFQPVQEGSGDPSPDNIRPISGWTGCNVYRTGVNVWDEEWESGAYNSSGEKVNLSSYIRSKNMFSVKPNTTYYYNAPSGRVCYYDSQLNFISRSNIMNHTTFTTPQDCYLITFFATETSYNNDISINYPSTDTDYHAYEGNTYPVNWTSSAGTVYGGSLDLTSGVLTAKYGYVDLGTLTYTRSTSPVVRFYSTISDMKASTRQTDMYCTQYKAITHGEVFSNSWDKVVYSGSNQVYITDHAYDNATGADFKTAMSGVYLCYELATPITYNLTPQQIKSLRGKNNVWTNTNGNTSIIAYVH